MLNANEYDTQHHGSQDVSDEEYRQMRSAEDDDYKPVVAYQTQTLSSGAIYMPSPGCIP